jgi:hypothetical protein
VTLPTVTVRLVGDEGEPVAVIENFASESDALRNHAATLSFAEGEDYYPGVKAAADPAYIRTQQSVLGPIFREVFGIAGRIAVLEASYALVSAPRQTLTLEQRMPHVDALEPGRLALIHYLVPGGCDGTAFYRHRSTGFETITLARSAQYFDRLNADLRTHGQPPDEFPNGSTPIFEQIDHFEGHYNRALIYRSRLLHSGAISPDSILPANPHTGRLTITGFFAAD